MPDDELRAAIHALQTEIRALRDGNGYPGVRQMASTLYGDERFGSEGLVEKMTRMHDALKELVQARKDDAAQRNTDRALAAQAQRSNRRLLIVAVAAGVLGLLGQWTELPVFLMRLIR